MIKMKEMKKLSDNDLVNVRYYPELKQWWITKEKETNFDERVEQVI